MKKLPFLICILIYQVCHSQAGEQIKFSEPPTADDLEYLKLVKQKRTNHFENNKDWVGYEYIDNERVSHTDERVINSGLTFGSIFKIPIFIDSLPKEKRNNINLKGVAHHSFGGIFDPSADDFVLIGKNKYPGDNYTVDSIHIGGTYSIVTPGIIDTLRIVAFKADTTHDTVNTGLFPFQQTALKGFHLRQNPSMLHGYVDGLVDSNRIVINYILSPQDTSSSLRYFTIPIDMDIRSDSVFAFNAYFIPGGPYDTSDYYSILDTTFVGAETMNSFHVCAIQEDGPSPAPFALDPSSWGMTHTLSTLSRYGIHLSPNESKNKQIEARPSSALLIDYTFSAFGIVGIEDINPKNFTLEGNYPNPFKSVTKINYSLTKTSQVRFLISDITGKEIMNIDRGKQTTGSHALELNTADLHSGIYYYTIITDSGKETKKMVIL